MCARHWECDVEYGRNTNLEITFQWRETANVSKWQNMPASLPDLRLHAHTGTWVHHPQHELSLCGGLLWRAWDCWDVKKASQQVTQPTDSQVCLFVFRGSGQILWVSLAFCPRAAFFCLIKLRIVFKPAVLARPYMLGVRYAPWKRGFTKVYVCHGFISPAQNYCWL